MTTTKFIILATSVIAGSAAYWLTHRKKNTVEDSGAPFAKKERHYSPVFSHFKKPGFVGN
jgi:hypothetical protein